MGDAHTHTVRKKFLRPVEVEAEYGLSVGALAMARHRRRGIPFVKVGKRVLYAREDVERFLAAHRVLTRDAIGE